MQQQNVQKWFSSALKLVANCDYEILWPNYWDQQQSGLSRVLPDIRHHSVYWLLSLQGHGCWFEPGNRGKPICEPPLPDSKERHQRVEICFTIFVWNQGVVKGGKRRGTFGTMKTRGFSTSALSRFASFVIDGVLGPPCLVWHTWRRPCISVVPEATHEASQGPLKGAPPCQLKGLR